MQTIGLLFKILWSPAETMFLLSKNPRVLAPMLFLSAFSLIAGSVVLMKVDFADLSMRMIDRSAQGKNMPDDQKAQMQAVLNSPIARASFFMSTVVAPVLTILVVGVVYFALFTMIGREGGFKAFLSITTFAFIPMIFSEVASTLRAFLVPSSSLMLDELGSLSAALFVNRDSVSPVLFAAVNSIDVVTIWTLVLLVIGYGYVASKSLSKSLRAAAVLGVFFVYVAAKLASAAIRGV